MLVILSPAKTLNWEPVKKKIECEMPAMLSDSAQLVSILRNYDVQEIQNMMDISPDLGQLNWERFQAWTSDPKKMNFRPAIFAFNGDVYDGLQASTLTTAELKFAQRKLRILSGLYGVLKPFDALQAYRLEMGTRLANSNGSNLYQFWGTKITEALNEVISEEKVAAVINAASEEYFKAVKVHQLTAPVITPVFLDWKNGQYKVISFFAKRARGLFARYCIQQKIKKIEQVAQFSADGYRFCPEQSSEFSPVFKRKLP